MDIGLFDNRLFKAFKWCMGNQSKSVGIVDQRIACNTRCLLISLWKSSVNDQQLAVALDRTFPLLELHRHMTIDNMTPLRIHTEFPENHITDIFSLDQFIIIILTFFLQWWFIDKISLKCGHFLLAENRWILIGPDEPHNILTVKSLFRITAHIISLSCAALKEII